MPKEWVSTGSPRPIHWVYGLARWLVGGHRAQPFAVVAFCQLLLMILPWSLSTKVKTRLDDVAIIEPRILKALSEHSAQDLFYRGQGMRIPLARADYGRAIHG